MSIAVDEKLQSSNKSSKHKRSSDLYDGILWRMRSLFENPSQLGVAGFLSYRPFQGVTTVATNVAMRAVENQFGRVLLVDANSETRGLSKLLKLRKSVGLCDYLEGTADLESTICKTSVDGLFVMPIGGRGSEIVLQPSMAADLVGELRASFDFVVFDLSPPSEMNPATLLAQQVDAAILVIRSGTCHRDEARRKTQGLIDDRVNLVGSVMTRHRRYTPNWMDRWL
jgi:polysaccharide biosynthesis transport protein